MVKQAIKFEAPGLRFYASPELELSLVELKHHKKGQMTTVFIDTEENPLSLSDLVRMLNNNEEYVQHELPEVAEEVARERLASYRPEPDQTVTAPPIRTRPTPRRRSRRTEDAIADRIRHDIRNVLLDGRAIRAAEIRRWDYHNLSAGAISRHLMTVVGQLRREGHDVTRFGRYWAIVQR